ncbi:hypothetical protein GYB14_06735 [bacterium]|nr:hypothetical protein [bacterium]
MALTHFNTRPMPDNGLRKKKAQDVRKEIGKVADRRPARTVLSNEEELAFPLTQPTSFTKGLKHDEYGFVSRADYEGFVMSLVQSQQSMASAPINGSGSRKWESPLAGHYFETEGPDPGALAMAPAPKLGSSELCSEMAVLYAMALVRDIAFSDLAVPSTRIGQTYPAGHPKEGTAATVQDLVDELRKLSWMDPNKSTYGYSGKLDGLNAHEMRRRAALWEDTAKGLTVQSLFRGSTYGAKQGPMLSQFLLLGTGNKADAKRDPLNGLISYGAQTIDQRVEQAKESADYMTTWEDWLAIQNGSDVNDPVDQNQWVTANRLITTPRDLATYVHSTSSTKLT